jgi:hypothetical protein
VAQILANVCTFQKLLKANNRPMGENSPNLNTLLNGHLEKNYRKTRTYEPCIRVTRWAIVYFGQFFKSYRGRTIRYICWLHFSATCVQKSRIFFWTKWVGLHFGQCFHKLIWSLCRAFSVRSTNFELERKQLFLKMSK